MPELPEVEAITRTLRALAVGRRIRSVNVLHAIGVKAQKPAQVVRMAQGQRVLAVERRGKYLCLELEENVITLHFKLDGHLVWFRNMREMEEVANAGRQGVHVDVAFELENGVLCFADGRHFGRVHTWKSANDCPGIEGLGVDALSASFTREHFGRLLGGSKRTLKEFLLDQSKVAGTGNIYSCESLWQAKLDPRRAANSLNSKEARRLHKAIVSVLLRALKCCLHPAPEFRDPKWWFQGLEKTLCAYGREGKPCRRCGNQVKRITQGGRSTYFCASCQR